MSRLGGFFQFPERAIIDPQHNLLSSGGVGQYVCNELVRQIVEQDLATLDQLDAFCDTIKLPVGQSRLTRTFFQDRAVLEPGHHIRTFAG